jgi:hypothetical protein
MPLIYAQQAGQNTLHNGKDDQKVTHEHISHNEHKQMEISEQLQSAGAGTSQYEPSDRFARFAQFQPIFCSSKRKTTEDRFVMVDSRGFMLL